MSGMDSAIGNLVQELLSGMGADAGVNLTASCTLNMTQKNYDPLSGSAPSTGTTSFPLDCTPPDQFHQSQINHTSIKQGDFKIWVSAFQLAAQDGAPDSPAFGMSVTFNNRDYDIVAVEPVYVGNTAVLFGLHCRE